MDREKSIQTQPEINSADIFGGCPKCGANDGIVYDVSNLTDNWFVCATHKYKWNVGNVISAPDLSLIPLGILQREWKKAKDYVVTDCVFPVSLWE